MNPLRLLFVCVENACRSQMAEAFARHHGGGEVEARSAGSEPAERVNPRALAFMEERGIPLEGHRPKGVAEVEDRSYDAVVTMGCGDACPHIPAHRREDWPLPDPARAPDVEFREIRDEVERRVLALLETL